MVGRGARIIPGVKDSFRLWIPIDDLNKYAWLARDWCISEANTDISEGVVNPKERLAAVTEAMMQLGVAEPKLSTSERLSMVGVVTTLAKYANAEKQTHIITEDRFKCLHLLRYYFKTLGNPNNLSLKDWVELSYAYCVTSGEFNLREWKDLAWAFYSAKIRRHRDDIALWGERWFYKPDLKKAEIEKTIKGNTDLINQINGLMKEQVEAAGSFHKFWKALIQEAMEQMSKSSKWLVNHVKNVSFRDRSLTLQTDLTAFKPSMGDFVKAITAVLGEKLGDENIVTHLRLDNGRQNYA